MAYTLLESSVNQPSKSTIVTLSDIVDNDSSKILLLSDTDGGVRGGANFLEILAIRIEITATATVGTRLMAVRIENVTGPDILYVVTIANNTVVASASGVWQLAPAVDEAITSPQQVQIPPGLFVFAGQQLVVEDSAAIDAAADDMVVHVLGRLY